MAPRAVAATACRRARMSAVRLAPNAFSNCRCACAHPFIPARKRASPASVMEELEVRGIRSKSWTTASGRRVGGKPFSRGALYLMLQNRLYRGEIVHKGQPHPGEHTPIINQPLWEAVQAQL